MVSTRTCQDSAGTVYGRPLPSSPLQAASVEVFTSAVKVLRPATVALDSEYPRLATQERAGRQLGTAAALLLATVARPGFERVGHGELGLWEGGVRSPECRPWRELVCLG